MSKEVYKIVLIVLVLILAGWGISSFLNNKDNDVVLDLNNRDTDVVLEDDIVPEINITPEEPEENIIMEEPKQLTWESSPEMQIDIEKNYKAILKTSKGDMEIELYTADNPVTVNNFVFLAKEKYYENVKFHRIIKDFMIQTGDPAGTGAGGPGYQFDDELPVTKSYDKGIVAMANAGPNTNGSQFFIMHANYPLPPNYIIFGKVTEGIDTLDTIAETKTISNGMGEISAPVEDIRILSVEIREN
jgi:cyclophilin family peptidyl-prolyl cis-trans isomerase